MLCLCSVGAGVAHTDREAQDEERGGAAGTGTGFRPGSGGLKNTPRQTHTHPLFSNLLLIIVKCSGLPALSLVQVINVNVCVITVLTGCVNVSTVGFALLPSQRCSTVSYLKRAPVKESEVILFLSNSPCSWSL